MGACAGLWGTVVTRENWQLLSSSLSTTAELSGAVATSHIWLPMFKLIKMKYSLEFSFLGFLAGSVSGVCNF